MNKQATPWLCASVFLLSSLAHATAQALDLDAPAIVWQEHLRRLEQIAPARPAPEPPEPKPLQGVAPESTVRVTFTEIQFSQTALLSTEELRAIGLNYLGRELQTADIQSLLNDVSALYQRKGILTAVPVLPQQDLQSGLLRVLLVEGRLGQVTVRNVDEEAAQWVQRWFDLPANEVVTNAALTSRLALFNAASDRFANAEFVAGTQFGVSDLAIDLLESPASRFWTFLETTHAKSASPGLLAFGWRKAPVSLRGGRLDAALVATDQGQTIMGGTSWPLGVQGWRAGISGSKSKTRTTQKAVTPEGADLVVGGESTATNLELGKTWVLNGSWTWGQALSYGTIRSGRSFDGVRLPSLDTRLEKLALTNTFSYETRPTRAAIKTTLSTSQESNNHYRHLDLAAQVHKNLDDQGHWQGRLSGMARLASNGQGNANEQLALGGADTVRGFDVGASTGDKGGALQLELRYRKGGAASESTEVYVFADAGKAWTAYEGKAIGSVGVGLQHRLNEQLGLEALASRQVISSQGSRSRLVLRVVGSW